MQYCNKYLMESSRITEKVYYFLNYNKNASMAKTSKGQKGHASHGLYFLNFDSERIMVLQ